MNKKYALTKYLDIKLDDLNGDDNDDSFEYGREGYLVLTDDEANEKTKEYILDSIWAFRADFLAAHLKDGINQDVVELIQSNDKCEDNNEAIKSLIEDIDHFVSDAIACDGRGHFLSTYDGEENEINAGGKLYYIYRTN